MQQARRREESEVSGHGQRDLTQAVTLPREADPRLQLGVSGHGARLCSPHTRAPNSSAQAWRSGGQGSGWSVTSCDGCSDRLAGSPPT